jgi:hypothetical protein
MSTRRRSREEILEVSKHVVFPREIDDPSRYKGGQVVPTPMELFCPKCEVQHIDSGEWATKLHRTHLCAGCGHLWRPSEHPTVGVTSVA